MVILQRRSIFLAREDGMNRNWERTVDPFEGEVEESSEKLGAGYLCSKCIFWK
jgi:hypothetical protein